MLFVLIEWLIPDEEKSLVDLETQTKFILDRKRAELRENQLIEAQKLERHETEQNDGSRTNRSTVTQSTNESHRLIPGSGFQILPYNFYVIKH